MHHVDPDSSAFSTFRNLPRDTPIHMINLIRFRAHAAYPDDHPDAGLGRSGADAYACYGRESNRVFSRCGGRILWLGRMESMLIGPADEYWDTVFIATYPHADAFLQMLADDEYRKAVIHRQAAVETSRLIRCAPRNPQDPLAG